MLILPEAAHPVEAVVYVRPESNSQEVDVLFLLVGFIDPVDDGEVSLLGLELIELEVSTECAVVHLVPDFLGLLNVLLPDTLVAVEVLEHAPVSVDVVARSETQGRLASQLSLLSFFLRFKEGVQHFIELAVRKFL